MTPDRFNHTERSVLNALRARHAPKVGGNGPEWAFVEHVRNAAGFNANRTLDAIGLNLWPSRGMELHGYEVKVSRADFRREIADPEKMDAFAHVLDRFWIVAPKGIVPRDELPATWGLLEVSDDGSTIRQKVAAPLLTEVRAEIPRTFLVPLLRAAGAVVQSRPEDMQAEYQRGFNEGVIANRKSGTDWQGMYERQAEHLDTAREQVRQIDEALGFTVAGSWRVEDRTKRLKTVASAVKAAVGGAEVEKQVTAGIKHAHRQLHFAKQAIERAQQDIEQETGVKSDRS